MTCAAILKGCFKENPLFALTGEVMHFPLSQCGQFAHSRGTAFTIIVLTSLQHEICNKKTLDSISHAVKGSAVETALFRYSTMFLDLVRF